MNHVVVRTLIYCVICISTYVVLSFLSVEPDYSPKAVLLMEPGATASQSIAADEVRILPFQPENTESVAWINIERAESDAVSRQLVEQKAKELAGSVGADGIVVIGEGESMNMGPSKYPLFVLRARAVRYR